MFRPRATTSARTARLTLLFPIRYMIATAIRGPLVRDWYPYPFADVAAHGSVRVRPQRDPDHTALLGRRSRRSVGRPPSPRAMTALVRATTAGALGALAGLHVAWGRGSSFPFHDVDELTNAVAGRRTLPPPRACFAVAGALTVASSFVADVPRLPRPVQRIGVTGVAVVLATRGGLGVAGRTDVLSPGSVSARFRRLDRRLYAPLCLALAAGALSSRRP